MDFEVAIKICKTDVSVFEKAAGLSSSQLLQTAAEEAKTLNELVHPLVVTLFEHYTFNSKVGGSTGIALVMEYCANGDLQAYLEKSAIVSNQPKKDRRLIWCMQLAGALEYIHSKKICHRDIKPANILLDANYNVKFGDVGLAKAAWDIGAKMYNIDTKKSTFEQYLSTTAGTPAYMAPEVWAGHYTGQSDIFSLGLVFVVILETPTPVFVSAKYDGKENCLGKLLQLSAKAREFRATDLIAISTKFASSGQPQMRLFNNMLEYSPRKRITAAEVEDDLKRMLQNERISLPKLPKVKPLPGQSKSACSG
jgi:serine/threonine protein kinase